MEFKYGEPDRQSIAACGLLLASAFGLVHKSRNPFVSSKIRFARPDFRSKIVRKFLSVSVDSDFLHPVVYLLEKIGTESPDRQEVRIGILAHRIGIEITQDLPRSKYRETAYSEYMLLANWINNARAPLPYHFNPLVHSKRCPAWLREYELALTGPDVYHFTEDPNDRLLTPPYPGQHSGVTESGWSVRRSVIAEVLKDQTKHLTKIDLDVRIANKLNQATQLLNDYLFKIADPKPS